MVVWNYIDEDGNVIFRDNLVLGPSSICDDILELGRFLHKASKVK